MSTLVSVKLLPVALRPDSAYISGPSGVSVGGKLASGVPPNSEYIRTSAEVSPAL